MIDRSFLVAALVAATVGPVAAAEGTLEVPHTQAQFTVTHLALSKVHGQLPLISGTVTFNDAGLPTATTATFDVKGVDSKDERRDASLRRDYFEVEKYPTLTFVERKIEGTPAAFKMTGDMTLHGVTKPIVLNGKVENVLTINGKKHVAYSATGAFDRRDFGIVFAKFLDNQLLAGYDVTLTIEADAGEK